MSPLPTQKTPPKRNLAEKTVLIYGPPGIGKSTWCGQAPDAIFFACEPGLNEMEVYQQPCTSWAELVQAAKELLNTKHAFRSVVIDTIDAAYAHCVDHITKRHRIEHESDLEAGKGYSLISAEMRRLLMPLAASPYGLYLTSHARADEIKVDGKKRRVFTPSLPNSGRKVVLGMVDMILFAMVDNNGQRVIRTQPTAEYDAKARGQRNQPLPVSIPLEYEAFVAAYEASKNPNSKNSARNYSDRVSVGGGNGSASAQGGADGGQANPAQGETPTIKARSLADRADAAVQAFAALGVSAAQLCAEVGDAQGGWAEGELEQLEGLYRQLRAGEIDAALIGVAWRDGVAP